MTLSKRMHVVVTMLIAMVSLASAADDLGAYAKTAEKELAGLRVRVKADVPVSHELSAYLIESAGIIDRLIAAIRQDLADSTPHMQFEARAEAAECKMLLASLAKELDLIARNTAFEAGAGRKTFNVRQYGAQGDGKSDDGPALRKAVVAARSAGPGSRVLLPAGRYALASTPGGGHLVLDACSDMLIEGQGSVTLVCKTVAAGLVIRNCTNVQVRGVNIDYAPLPYALGTIVATDPPKATFDMKLHAGYPRPDSPIFLKAKYLRGTVRDPKTGKLFRKEGDLRAAGVKEIGEGLYRITVADNAMQTKAGMTAPHPIGHYYSLHARATPGGGTALYASDSDFVTLDRVNVYASYSHSYLAVGCDGLKMLHCVTEPLPASGRLACNNADSLHCPSNRKGPYLESCRFLRGNDDCANLYSKAYCVAKVESPTGVTLDYRAGGGPDGETLTTRRFRKGDPLVFINPTTAETEGFATIANVTRKTWRGRPNLHITLDRPVTGLLGRDKLNKGPAGGREYVGAAAKKAHTGKPIEHFVINLASKSDGFVIRNGLFGENRAGGIKFKATNGVMRNTTIRGGMYCACLFKIALDWREGYFPRNILLKGNTLSTPRATSTYVGLPVNARVDPRKFIRRIRIED